MFHLLGEFVSRRWVFVIFFWVLALVGVRAFSPQWDRITLDGDFAYLPRNQPTLLGGKINDISLLASRLFRSDSDRPLEREEMSSVVGERLLKEAFPDNRAKSQIALVVAREDRSLDDDDLKIVDNLARRFYNYHGASTLERARHLIKESDQFKQQGNLQEADKVRIKAESLLTKARKSLDLAIQLDENFASALHNRAILHEALSSQEDADRDRRLALKIDPDLIQQAGQVVPKIAGELPLLDVWTRDTDLVKSKLLSEDEQAQLIILQLSNEFMAVDNIRVMEFVEAEVAKVSALAEREQLDGLQLAVSGSACVGADILRSAKESIRNTEKITILLVVLILLAVYRSPVLILVPLLTIAVSFMVSTGIVAALTQVHLIDGMDWWSFKVFTTTRIFIVVILFGAGTDYCLFLISRYKEHLDQGCSGPEAISQSLAGVGGALAASALTTILGLAMMIFADFKKFSNSGPAIGICLLVTLIACLTLTPAILRALGEIIFWPWSQAKHVDRGSSSDLTQKFSTRLWHQLASRIVARPGVVLVLSIILLMPLAVLGFSVDVTYDLQSELSPTCASRRGTEILKRHFPVGESGPVIVLAESPLGKLDTADGERAIRDLTSKLYLNGVIAVRSIADPLGNRLGPEDYEKNRSFSPSRLKDWQDLALRKHPLTREIFLTPVKNLQGNVARFELIFSHDPFSLDAVNTLSNVDRYLKAESLRTDSFWKDSQFVYTGTTAAIGDLRTVTQLDNQRIMVLVVLVVLAVLIILLRRPMICVYLIASVLFSYLVTIGATQLFFTYAYGDSFQGLDWKVPLFLFVILVAIGEDYNIYLVTRVFEEQNRHGPFNGLRKAIVRTGGIITSCGIIMAGTFISMTSGSLRGMSELGFALSLGVLLETMVVRPVLVPAFIALTCRLQGSSLQSQPAHKKSVIEEISNV